jgi:cytochrome c peroxidase
MKLVVWVAIVAGCGGHLDEPDLGPAPPSRSAQPAVAINPRLLRRFKPLRELPEEADPVEVARIALGKQLFFDPRLSRTGSVACSSCHPLDRGGADGRPTSVGVGGKVGLRNAPTVYNAAWHVAQFWDGRAADLEAQARVPLLSPDEMAMRSPAEVVKVLESVPGYVAEFRVAFPGEPLDFDHVVRALAAFEETLATPARWDRYLRGDHGALAKPEVEGLKLFANIGCVQCHTGELVGSMFQRVGVVEPWPNQRDQGRFAITKRPDDQMVFKVPTLRNVAMTGPYFHDGSVASLDEAVRLMARHQLGAELPAADVTAIVAWLGALTGEPPTEASSPPILP